MYDTIAGWIDLDGQYVCADHIDNPVGCTAVFKPTRVCRKCLPQIELHRIPRASRTYDALLNGVWQARIGYEEGLEIIVFAGSLTGPAKQSVALNFPDNVVHPASE